MVIIVFFLLHWYLSLFTQTFFHHRYAAHRMFTMSKGWEHFFYILSWLFQGSSYLSPYAYGVMHRLHHTYADTELDPHSPIYSKNLFDMMWKTRTIYSNIVTGKVKIDPKFTRNVPRWDAMENFADSMYSRIAWVAVYVAVYVVFCHHWWLWPLLPVQIVISPVHGAVINWFAHKFGYVNYKVNDTSRNLMPVDILMLGESYHNNHHKFGGRANFGSRWFEIDPIYPVMKLFNKLHIIKLKVNNDLNYM